MEPWVSSETDVDVKKLHCVGCAVIDMWIEVAQVEDALKHLNMDCKERRCPTPCWYSKTINETNFLCFNAFFVFTNSYFLHLCSLRSFCIWLKYRVIQEGWSVFRELVISVIVRGNIDMGLCITVHADREGDVDVRITRSFCIFKSEGAVGSEN